MRNYKFEIIFAFIIFAFILTVTLTYTAIYIFSNFTTKEFKEKISLIAKNTYLSYKQKEKTIENTIRAFEKNEIFNSEFKPNFAIIKPIFKLLILANNDIKEIYFNNLGCKNEGLIVCNKAKINLNNLKEYLTKVGIGFKISKKIKQNSILIKATFPFPKKLNTFYDLLIIDNNGKIYYSTLSYNAKNIADLYNYLLLKKILKNEGFVSEDIFVKNFSKNIKFIFVQNKNVIKKTDSLSQKIAFVILLIAIFISIPLGIFFSRPLYNFYEELNKKVKEEIEKRREKEELLAHQSKLAAMGEMLGNIAHQWRHPLTRLSLLIQNLEINFRMKKLNEKTFNSFLENAFAQINYMSNTIDDFTNFFKKDTQKKSFLIKDVVNECLKLLDSRISQNKVNVEVKVIRNKLIFGYKTEFSQVILNILNNAIDALKERNIKDKKIIIKIDGKSIEIADNAGGIDDKIKNKIFEPYFTTKTHSTGIGLYMSKIIIQKRFNGKIEVKNSQNGAIFRIMI